MMFPADHLSTQVFPYRRLEEKRRVLRYGWDIPRAIKGNTHVTQSVLSSIGNLSSNLLQKNRSTMSMTAEKI